jgi:hypothetical protein
METEIIKPNHESRLSFRERVSISIGKNRGAVIQSGPFLLASTEDGIKIVDIKSGTIASTISSKLCFKQILSNLKI